MKVDVMQSPHRFGMDEKVERILPSNRMLLLSQDVCLRASALAMNGASSAGGRDVNNGLSC
jgi:hypothetical protein